MLSTEELEKVGIIDVSTKFKKRCFYIDGLDEEITIPDYYNMSDVYKKIFEIGIEKGIEKGKKEKIKEFKEVFNLD